MVKDWGGKLPVALVYPNNYFIGMSNLGLHAIYSLLNSRDDVVCERFFQEKNTNGMPLSVESQRPLTDFAVIAFTVNFELDYFNVAPLLKSSGIPVYSAERDETYPLVIAGGPCIMANPAPLAAFFDCLGIGEAEPLFPAMLPVISKSISGKRLELLEELSRIPGIYVPRAPVGKPAVRQYQKNLDDFPVHSAVLTQDTELGDMYLIEVERGCGHGCRFCLVGETFSPIRFHSVERLLEQAREGLKYRKRLGLVGPAVTDHPQIEELLTEFRQMGAGLAISSLRMNTLTPKIIHEMVEGGLRTITLAPEAGSECLRQVIKKGITEKDILEAIGESARQGMQQLKLYFMVGLPEEGDEDIEEIVNLVLAGKAEIERQHAKTRITLNVSPFVPKARTAFQYEPMAAIPLLNERLDWLKKQLSDQGIQIKGESPQWSEVQAVLARGDEKLTPLLAEMERASLPEWRKAVEKHGIAVNFYAHQRWDSKTELPWGVQPPC